MNTDEKIDLTSFATFKDGEAYSGTAIQISVLDSSGKASSTYSYSSAMDLSGGSPKPTIAWNKNGVSISKGEVLFDPGQGFWIQGNGEGFSLQNSGSVSKKDILVELNSGFTISGNAYPTSLDLTDILTYKEGVSYNGTAIQLSLLNSNGKAQDTYSYSMAMDMSSGTPTSTLAWNRNGVIVKKGDVLIEPGTAFWIQANGEGYSVRFPAPEL